MQISWALHGNLSHLAIRRHIYRNLDQPPAAEVISVQVRVFLAGLPAVLSPLRRRSGNRAS